MWEVKLPPGMTEAEYDAFLEEQKHQSALVDVWVEAGAVRSGVDTVTVSGTASIRGVASQIRVDLGLGGQLAVAPLGCEQVGLVARCVVGGDLQNAVQNESFSFSFVLAGVKPGPASVSVKAMPYLIDRYTGLPTTSEFTPEYLERNPVDNTTTITLAAS